MSESRQNSAVGERLYRRTRFKAAGDRGLLVEYGRGIAPEINTRVLAMAQLLESQRPAGLVEVVPTYRSLLLVYNPLETNPSALENEVLALEAGLGEVKLDKPKTVVIPVCYGGEYGPDIDFVAQNSGLSVEEVVARHTAPAYPIYMIGFTPGFPFLGGLDVRLHAPRLATPRHRVARGSVGIAGAQTGVYPLESPGGWRLIGRTPINLFAPEKREPFLYSVGDLLRFEAITPSEFERLEAESK